MYPRAQRLVTGTERWFQWINAHGVPYDGAIKSLDEIAQDYYESGDAYRELLATDPTGTTSATYEAVANTAYGRALLIEDASGRRGGDLDFYVDPAPGLDPEGWIVTLCPTPEAGAEWESIATPSGAHQVVVQPHATGLRP